MKVGADESQNNPFAAYATIFFTSVERTQAIFGR